MELSTGSMKLSLAGKTLHAQWEEVKTNWKDRVSQSFEENHLRLLEMQTTSTLNAINRLAQTLAQARADCS